VISQLRAVLVIFGLLTLVTGLVYPGVVTLIGQVVFPYQANGSVLIQDGQAKGSELIGQPFKRSEESKYFWGRPSATTPEYNAASSSGSNLGPTNQDWLDAVRDRIEVIRKAHPDQAERPIPVDLVTASASGLDPHISPAAAEYQVTRVAGARGLPPDDVRRLVAAHTEGRTLGILGEPRVNVLRLNLALDGLPGQPKP
jgi:potassium-transporting ATPase KdpC subunit